MDAHPVSTKRPVRHRKTPTVPTLYPNRPDLREAASLCLLWTLGRENRYEQHPPILASVAIVPVIEPLAGAAAIAAVADLDDDFVAVRHIGELDNLHFAGIPLAAVPSVRNDPAFDTRYIRSRTTVAAGSEVAPRTATCFLWFAIDDAAAVASVCAVAARRNVKAVTNGQCRGVAAVAAIASCSPEDIEPFNADRAATATAAAGSARDDCQAMPRVPRPLDGS